MIRLVAALLLVSLSTHAETCLFGGTTSYDGHLAIQADAAQVDDLLTPDITVHAWMTDDRYLGQEITIWPSARGGARRRGGSLSTSAAGPIATSNASNRTSSPAMARSSRGVAPKPSISRTRGARVREFAE